VRVVLVFKHKRHVVDMVREGNIVNLGREVESCENGRPKLGVS